MRMSEKCRKNINQHNSNNSDNPLISRCTDGDKMSERELSEFRLKSDINNKISIISKFQIKSLQYCTLI